MLNFCNSKPSVHFEFRNFSKILILIKMIFIRINADWMRKKSGKYIKYIKVE